MALTALERKVCVTQGKRSNSPADRCAEVVDRATYIQPLLDVFLAGPPIMRAYLCSLDRVYFDHELNWNADFRVMTDEQTGKEYRSIGVRRGLLELKVGYLDWASGWTQHWWTGAAHDHPQDDRALPRVESDLSSSKHVLFQLVAHELAHLLDYDYRIVMRRQPESKAFEPGEFGFLGWISPRYVDSTGRWHRARARDTAVESVRTIDFDGNNAARAAMRIAAAQEGRLWNAGAVDITSWLPASHERIAPFLEQLDRSNFTTVFSTWRPEDDWTESFAMMMLLTIASRYDIVTANRRISVLQKVLDEQSPFGPKRRFIQQVIERALRDFRARQAATPDACLSAALVAGPLTVTSSHSLR